VQVGRFGVTGDAQTLRIKHLSDGLKSRVVFSWLAQRTPHMLLLDEPTNHLDIETIDSLAKAINGAWGNVLGAAKSGATPQLDCRGFCCAVVDLEQLASQQRP
jgi:ABC-type histidine transport system ATPase subunit